MINQKYVCINCNKEDITVLDCEYETEDWCFNCEDATTIKEIKINEGNNNNG